MRGIIFVAAVLMVVGGFRAAPVSAASARIDFNGDGRADLYLRNPFSGAISVWLANGSGVTQHLSVANVPNPSTGWAPIGLRDMDGDGRTDILWRNSNTGELNIWRMSGGTVVQSGSLGVVAPATGWTPSALADFNGDGRADILWRNAYTGEIVVWLINGTVLAGGGSVNTVSPTSGWTLIGVDDLNGDRKADLVWRNVQTGEIVVWIMNGAVLVGGGSLGVVGPATGWAPFAIGDVSGDGRADILWRNIYTADLAVWLLNSVSAPVYAGYGRVAFDSGWSPIGLEDFNGDGRKDILWYNVKTSEYYVYYLNGGAVSRYLSLGTVAPTTGWGIAGTDDFDGNGAADILWYNTFNYNLLAWIMSGSGGSSQAASFGNVPTPSVWQLGG